MYRIKSIHFSVEYFENETVLNKLNFNTDLKSS